MAKTSNSSKDILFVGGILYIWSLSVVAFGISFFDLENSIFVQGKTQIIFAQRRPSMCDQFRAICRQNSFFSPKLFFSLQFPCSKPPKVAKKLQKVAIGSKVVSIDFKKRLDISGQNYFKFSWNTHQNFGFKLQLHAFASFSFRKIN